MKTIAIAAPSKNLADGFSRFFPNETDPSHSLGPHEFSQLAGPVSKIYALLIQEIAHAASQRLSISPQAVGTVIRNPVVIITYLFLDRLLRLKKWMDQGNRSDWGVISSTWATPELLVDLIHASSSSHDFNEALLARVAKVWQLPDSARPPQTMPSKGQPISNLNFASPGLTQRLSWKWSRITSRIAGRIPTLGMAYAESDFLDAGLFGAFKMADLNGPQERRTPPVDAQLRQDILAAACVRSEAAIKELLSSWRLNESEQTSAIREFTQFCADMFPRACLEDLARRLKEAELSLRRYAPHPILASEIGDDRTAAMLAAAGELKMPVIGLQHGAHYGFVDAPCHIELEHAHVDRFVTWGWTQMPDHPLCRDVETIALPSPWMSERARRWRNARAGISTSSKTWDTLVMTERISNFPPPITTVRLGRLDGIVTLDAELESLVRALTSKGLSVLHKPFNATSALAQNLIISKLREECGARYAIYDRPDKGLSLSLLSSVGLVIWDEPGGGLFECLVSGIPTLLLWTRSQYGESPRAAGAFSALEQAGIVHRSAISLADTASFIRSHRAEWASDPQRKTLIADVCRELAWCDDQWVKPWRDFIGTL